MSPADPLDLFRPLLLIAAVAFLLGFAGFVMADGGRTVRASRVQALAASPLVTAEVAAARF